MSSIATGEGGSSGVAQAIAAEAAAEAPAPAPFSVGGPVGVDSAPHLVRRRDSLFRRFLAVADVAAVTAALATSAAVLGGDTLTAGAIAVPFVFVLLAKSIGLYDRDEHLLHRTTLDEVPSLFGIATLTALLIWLANGLVIEQTFDRLQVVEAWGLLFVLLIAFRAVARTSARAAAPVERCLFVGDEARAQELGEKLAMSHSVKAELVGWLPLAGRRSTDDPAARGEIADQVRTLVAERKVERIVLGPGVSETMLEEIRRGAGTKVSILPALSRLVNSSFEFDRLSGIALLGMHPFQITASSRIVKRSFDLAGSAAGLVVLSPLLAVIAVAIKLDSPGPVLFRQHRAGRHGEPFEMLKFRSMVDGADAQKDSLRHLNEADGVFKIADDPRITRIGRALRRVHADELPQLLNVLRGDMSVVGPRPLPLDEDRQIEGTHRRRLDLRPGITGPWQVLGSAQIPMSEMVKLDYQYVANWSLWGDVRTVLLTVPRIVRRAGR